MSALFRANGDGTYDLTIDGRAAEYDVPKDQMAEALRRRRYEGKIVEIEENGVRTRLGRR